MSELKRKIIDMILQMGIIKTDFKEPITFKSGIKSPIYCNFRECSKDQELMRMIATLFQEQCQDKGIEVVMGVAVGALPHSTLLSQLMGLPAGYIRPGSKPKEHGLKNLIEGADVKGKTVLLIEDLITTGGSAVDNALILRKEGAKEVFISSIFSYGFNDAEAAFASAQFSAKSLITVHDIMPAIKEKLSAEEYWLLADWMSDPKGWFDRHKAKFSFGFLTRLRQTTEKTGSIICMGFDPVLPALPKEFGGRGVTGACLFYKTLLSEMKSRNILPAAFKPNEGFWTRTPTTDFLEYRALYKLRNTLHDTGIPTTIDTKRGDIGKSSDNYAVQYLGSYYDYDAITISPFMGTDSVGPFIKFCNSTDAKGVYILNKTSNSGSKDLQMMKMFDGRFLYEHVTDLIIGWAKGKPGVGAVAGGNSPDELRTILKQFAGKDIPVLVPGVGAQGGSAEQVTQVAKEVGFERSLLRINSSSGLTHPWYKKEGDFIPSTNECVDMCIAELEKLNKESAA